RDKILIVDDVIRSGRTLFSIYKLISKANATVVGSLIIATNTDEWKKKVDLDNVIVIFKI
ncbi:MAG: phosphoribosyltransferase family protein, partial [Saccharolobus sp.]